MKHSSSRVQGKISLEHAVFDFLHLRFKSLTFHIAAFVGSKYLYSKQDATTLTVEKLQKGGANSP
jgi:hypothetical protein